MSNKKFDAREYLAANAPPTFIDVDGTEYVGKIMSFTETLKLAKRYEESFGKADSTATEEDLIQAVTEICTAVNIPADKVLNLPFPAVTQILQSFFV